MKDKRSYITEEGILKLLDEARKSSDRNYVLIMTMWLSGRRISELVRGTRGLGIKVKDIDFEKGLIDYNILKKSTPTRILQPVNPELLEVIRGYVQRHNLQEDSYLFPITRQRADQIVRMLSRRAGIKTAGGKIPSCHKFRHTFAVQIASSNLKANELIHLKDLLAHSDINMTLFYTQFGETKERELLTKLKEKENK